MAYKTAYDLAEYGFHERGTVITAICLFFGSLVLFAACWGRGRLLFFPVVALVGSLVLGIVGGLTYWDFNRLKQALVQNKCEVVEGSLQKYWTKTEYSPRIGASRVVEGFQVAGIEFLHTVDHSAAGFTNSQNPKVTLRDGLPVRVHFIRDPISEGKEIRILRFEIGRQEAVTTNHSR
jgi:hypothetical protein